MTYPQVTFQVRIKVSMSLDELGERVSKVLQCDFIPSESNYFAGDPALESHALGLWITLSGDPELSEGEGRTYVLMGMLKDEFEAQWELESPTLSISSYILGLLLLADQQGWYIPQRQELYTEAGLDWPDEQTN